MRLGISSYTYTWAVGVPGSLPERPMMPSSLLQKANALGVRVVQIADNMPLDQLDTQPLSALADSAVRLQIDIEVGTRGIGHAHLLKYVEIARQFHSPILRVVIDTATHHPEEDEVVGTLREHIQLFENESIVLAIENHDRFSARTFARIIERVGSQNVGICLDTVNSFGALEGPEVVLDVLGEYVVNLHIKDFSIQRHSHMMGFTIEGQPAGQGRLNIPWLLEQLAKQGRDPNAILELWTPPEKELDATIAKEDAWAVQSVQTLRRWISG
jgi:3-oxoisoapionate decarboxylase